MTASRMNRAARTFWDERPLSHRERILVDAATRWLTPMLQKSGRPIYMLSLTCKQAQPNGQGGVIWLTPELLWEALEIYFRRIDKLVYKNASRRFQKSIQRFVVLEGGRGTGKRLHVHMLVAVPPAQYMGQLEFIRAMITTWRSSPCARKDRTGKRDVAWDFAPDLTIALAYVMKTGLDAVDWCCTNP